MPFTGVSHKVGEHIDTDAIIPARFLVTTDPKKLGENCMEGLEHGWVKRVQVGDILVAERNFGCGSSREHAPIAILGAGMKAVIAHSFARIFYRNAFNMGLLLLEIGDDVNKIKDGDKLEVSPEEGVIKNLTRSEEHTSELQSPPIISYAVFCLKKKTQNCSICALASD
ncbi:3-isopropylmalate dehydratase small subunit [Bilophila wadsworthia]